MVTHWTALLILIHALTAETISITEVDAYLEALGGAGVGQSWDYTPLLQYNSQMQNTIGGPVRLTHAVCGQLQVENCNQLLKVASFVCAYTLEEHLQQGSLRVFMLTLKYKGCSIVEYIAAHMVAYAGEVVRMNPQTGYGLGSIQKSYGRKSVTYFLYQDMFPFVCHRVDPGSDQEPAGADSGLIATACNYLRRAGLMYLGNVTSSMVNGPAWEGLPKVYLTDRARMPIKYETVSMMFPQLCRQYPELEGCAAINGQVAILVSMIGEILQTTLAWEVNRAVDEFNNGRSFRLYHVRHFIPFTVCRGEARRAAIQCRYLLEDRLDTLLPNIPQWRGR